MMDKYKCMLGNYENRYPEMSKDVEVVIFDEFGIDKKSKITPPALNQIVDGNYGMKVLYG